MDDIDKIINKLDDVYKYAGIAGIIFFLLLTITLIAFWTYFKSYFEKLAEHNFGTKLAEIQGQIQQTLDEKSSQQQAFYNQQLAELTAKLDLDNSNKFENKSEERKSIISFLNSYSKLVFGTLDIKILDYGYNNYEEIDQRLKLINSNYSDLKVLENHVKFWSDDKELILKINDLTMSILKYSHFTQKLLGELNFNLKIGKTLRDSFTQTLEKTQETTDFLHEIAEQEKQIRENNNKLYQQYWKERQPYYQEFFNANLAFMNIASKYLK